jgi:hypothetical protein
LPTATQALTLAQLTAWRVTVVPEDRADQLDPPFAVEAMAPASPTATQAVGAGQLIPFRDCRETDELGVNHDRPPSTLVSITPSPDTAMQLVGVGQATRVNRHCDGCRYVDVQDDPPSALIVIT